MRKTGVSLFEKDRSLDERRRFAGHERRDPGGRS
jgi:hypothetical protein